LPLKRKVLQRRGDLTFSAGDLNGKKPRLLTSTMLLYRGLSRVVQNAAAI
jgi:hypothetical protein